MANTDLNKIKIYKRATITLSFLLILSTSLSIMTGGFTIWDRFHKLEKIPHVSLTIEPFYIEYDSAYNRDRKYSLFYTFETSGGIYKIGKDFKIDTFIIKEKDYFYDIGFPPSITLTNVIIDKYILDSRYPNLNGFFKLTHNFVFASNKLTQLQMNEQVKVATLWISFPYEFEGKKYTQSTEVPIILKR